MNIALPALIVFFLLLPGFIFRSNLKRAERTSLDFSPFGQVVAGGVLWASILHFFWLVASHLLFQRDFQPVILMKLISSAPASQTEASEAVGSQFGWIAAYFATLITASFAIPQLIRRVITRFRLDRADAVLSPIFRYHQAPWYYLLTGADFESGQEPDLIFVSAIVEVGKDAILYVGVLNEFHVDAEGQLDRLVLESVVRRPIGADKGQAASGSGVAQSRFYDVDGDSFVLRYSEAITLNIEYVRLDRDEPDHA